MAHTATEYPALIKRKETEIAKLVADLEALSDERDVALKHVTQLQGEIGTVSAQLEAQKADSARSSQHARLQKEWMSFVISCRPRHQRKLAARK